MSKNKTPSSDNTIVLNKKARHDYFIEDTYEAGIVLEGWEVKSMRAKSIQVKESYILMKAGEAWLTELSTNELRSLFELQKDAVGE